MDKKLKTKWVKALRSGKYKQGKGALKDYQRFCCLGVLADIQGCKWVAGGIPLFGDERAGRPDSPYGFLRPKFAGGLRYPTQGYLSELNDDMRPFSEIADYIEKRVRAR